MGTRKPKSEAGISRYAGPGGFNRLLSDMQGEKFGMSYDDCVRMTYRQVWERFVADALDEAKEFEQTADSTPSPAKTKTGAFEAHKATEKEANSFFDQLCGGRVYEGPKWWIPGEVPGIEHYNG